MTIYDRGSDESLQPRCGGRRWPWRFDWRRRLAGLDDNFLNDLIVVDDMLIKASTATGFPSAAALVKLSAVIYHSGCDFGSFATAASVSMAF